MPLVVVGLCGSGFPAFLYATGQTHIPSSAAGVFNSMTPIFTFLFSILFFSGKIYGKQLLGVILGFAGVLCLFFIKKEGEIAFPIFYSLLLILATVSYAISANTVNKFLVQVRPTIISVVSFTAIGPFMIIYLLNTDFVSDISQHDQGWQSFIALCVLSLAGTFLANILFFRLIQLTDAVFSSSVSFLIPIVALMWGVVDGERITLFHVLALGFILCGIFLVKRLR